MTLNNAASEIDLREPLTELTQAAERVLGLDLDLVEFNDLDELEEAWKKAKGALVGEPSQQTTDLAGERAETLAKALSHLQEAARLLNSYHHDPRVLPLIAQLEGMGHGWFHLPGDDSTYLADQLIDLMLEAPAPPIGD